MADLNTNTTELQEIKEILENKAATGSRLRIELLDGTLVPKYAEQLKVASKNIVAGGPLSFIETTGGLTNGNVYLNHIQDSTVTSSHKIIGTGATTVSGGEDGAIIISSSDSVVAQFECATASYYPVLMNYSAIPTSGAASPVYYNTKVTINPAYGILTATEIAVTGEITASSFSASSDARLKENFEDFSSERSILDLPIYKFDFIEGEKNQIGCKAQDLQEICPELVVTKEDGYLAIKESKLVYLLLDEVKKLNESFQKLKEENELLKQQVLLNSSSK